MQPIRLFVTVVIGSVLAGSVASAQDLSRYRVYVLESTREAVTASSAGRTTEVRTLHERPAKIEELDWRAPYLSSGSGQADPVRQITFTFYDGALYQIVVTYDRDRTEGLTNADIIASVSTTYGEPLPRSAGRGAGVTVEGLQDALAIAQWENETSSLTLLRSTYTPEFRLVLVSKPLSLRARTAIREAVRQDAVEAPRRELEERNRAEAKADAARDKTRAVNKEAFRP